MSSGVPLKPARPSRCSARSKLQSASAIGVRSPRHSAGPGSQVCASAVTAPPVKQSASTAAAAAAWWCRVVMGCSPSICGRPLGPTREAVGASIVGGRPALSRPPKQDAGKSRKHRSQPLSTVQAYHPLVERPHRNVPRLPGDLDDEAIGEPGRPFACEQCARPADDILVLQRQAVVLDEHVQDDADPLAAQSVDRLQNPDGFPRARAAKPTLPAPGTPRRGRPGPHRPARSGGGGRWCQRRAWVRRM